MIKLTGEEITQRNSHKSPPGLSLTVVLNNIRSLYNVGSIFRTSDAVGVEKIWLCGITGHPPEPKISKTALGAEKTVPWKYEADVVKVVRQLKEQGYQIVVLEQLKESVPYDQFDWGARVCLVLGNENEGVAEKIFPLADGAAEIEMTGIKHSLNVTVAFGIVAYCLRNILKKRVN